MPKAATGNGPGQAELLDAPSDSGTWDVRRPAGRDPAAGPRHRAHPLRQRGILEREREGRSFAYRALSGPEEYTAAAFSGLLALSWFLDLLGPRERAAAALGVAVGGGAFERSGPAAASAPTCASASATGSWAWTP